MKTSVIKGFSFGLTSGVITTLGLMVGLNSGTGSRSVVLAGILTIAIADAFSDALGIHISEEAENHHTEKEIWAATISTFIGKLVFALTFVIPVLLFKLNTAIIVSIVWGLLVLTGISYQIGKTQKINPLKVIREHLFIAIFVILITNFLGRWINSLFIAT